MIATEKAYCTKCKVLVYDPDFENSKHNYNIWKGEVICLKCTYDVRLPEVYHMHVINQTRYHTRVR